MASLDSIVKTDGDPWFTGEIAQQIVHTSKGPVEYCDVGTGMPVLYFHGNGAGNDVAVMLEKALKDDGCRLIVPNRPGYYNTPLTSGRSADDCADLAAALLDHLTVERAIVIGTSGGGLGACRFAARHPRKTAALILQCALAHPFDSGRWMPRGAGALLPLFRHLWLFRRLLRLANSRQAQNPTFISQCMSKARFAELREAPELRSLGPLLSRSMVRCAAFPAGTENDWALWTGEPWLTPGSVSSPTLILHDAADCAVPIAHAQWARQCIPHAEFRELRAGGHMLWIGPDRHTLRRERLAFIRRHANAPA